MYTKYLAKPGNDDFFFLTDYFHVFGKVGVIGILPYSHVLQSEFRSS